EEVAHDGLAGVVAQRPAAFHQPGGGVGERRTRAHELLVPPVLIDGDGLVGGGAAVGEGDRGGLLLQAADDRPAAGVVGGGEPDVDRFGGGVGGAERYRDGGRGDHRGGEQQASRA